MPFAGDIYYRESSPQGINKPPLVLVHGAGGSSLHWPSEMRRLGGERVLAIDLRGHGRSASGGAETISAYAESVLNFLDSMHVEQAVFAGHSMGSAILLHLSLDHPERVRGLILVGSGANLRVNPALIESCAAEETYPHAVKMVMSWAFGSSADPRLVELAGERMAEISHEVVLGDFYACDEFDLRGRIKEIEVPALVVCGSEDRMTPPRFSQALAEELPNAQLEIVPAAGHMLMLEKPAIVAGLVKSFLDQLN
jgi:pimeloyl-ACP methyl ester carboxylesterase